MDVENSVESSVSIEALQYYEDYPVEFIEDIIEAKLDPWQRDVANALRDYHFVSIRSGSGVGKTALLSLLTMWFMSTKPYSKVPTTAPSIHQLHDQLWGEHFKWISHSEFLDNLMDWTQTMVSVKNYKPVWYAAARTARVSPSGEVAEGLQGFHARSVLFIMDEASGIPDGIFPAVEGALTTEDAYAIMAGNPTKLQGYFYDSFNHIVISNLWKQFHISCLDSPRVTQRYIESMKAKYGEHSPIYMIKVLGEFPNTISDMLFPPAYIEAMRNNDFHEGSKDMPVDIGVDVGRTSNKSTIAVRQGFNVLVCESMFKSGGLSDVPDISNWVLEYIQNYQPRSVKVDAIGIGAGVFDILYKLYPKVVKPVIGSNSPSADEKQGFINVRAQGYWNLRNVAQYIHFKKAPEMLFVEMSHLGYKITDRSKVQIMSKEEYAKRHKLSPDHIDSVYYAFLDDDLCSNYHMQNVCAGYPLTSMNDSLAKPSNWAFYVNAPTASKWRVQ